MERARTLGASILRPMIDTIESVDAGERAGERHTVRADPDVIESLLAHLRDRGLKLEVKSDRTEDGERVVTKPVQSTNDKVRAYLDGHAVRE